MAGTKTRLFVVILTIIMIISSVIIGGSKSVLSGKVNLGNRDRFPLASAVAKICGLPFSVSDISPSFVEIAASYVDNAEAAPPDAEEYVEAKNPQDDFEYVEVESGTLSPQR